MLSGKSGAGGVVRREAVALISDARATSKQVNVLKEGASAEQSVEEEVRLCIAVSKEAPASVVRVVRDAFMPRRATAVVRVDSASEASIAGGTWDVVIVIADGSDPAVGDAVRTFARAGLPVALVAASKDQVPEAGLVGTAARRVTTILGDDDAALERDLANWLVRATGKGLAMAASFPFARHAEAEMLARECAGQNAMVGAFPLVPGSDLPVMAANEVRVVITYAALYGQGPSPARVLEMIGAVGAAMTHRRLSKSMSVPGLGIVIRAGVDYAGTLLACRAMARYYAHLEVEGGLGNVLSCSLHDILFQMTSSMASGMPTVGDV